MSGKSRVMGAAFPAAPSFKILAVAVPLFLVSVLALTCPAFGSTRYIAQSAGTFSGGAACNGQTAITPSTWNSTAESPGDVSYVCGTISGVAGQILLNVSWSGSSGDPISIIFDTGAVLTSPAWSANGAINTYGVNNIVINGGTNGIIENTANGTGLSYNQQTTGVAVQGGASGITIKNLTIKHLCMRKADDPGVTCEGSGDFSTDITVYTSNGDTYSNISIIGNTLSDAYAGIYFHGTASDTNILIQHNTIRTNNWGFATDGTNDLTVDGNDIACVVGAICNWDDTADDNHHDGIFVFPQSFPMKVVAVSNNWVHDFIGNTTALYFNDPGGSGSSESGTVFYNNVFSTTSGQTGPANGDLLPPAGSTIVNNTFFGPTECSVKLDNSDTFENNVVSSASHYGVCVTGSGDTFKYQDYFNTASGWGDDASNIFASLPAWQAGSTGMCSGGCDVTGSLVSDPKLSSSFMLGSGSAASGAGANLSSLGISGLSQGAPQYFGAIYACGTGCLPRPSSGTWDMGAYPSGSSSSGTKPNPPTNLTGTIVTN